MLHLKKDKRIAKEKLHKKVQVRGPNNPGAQDRVPKPYIFIFLK